MAAPARTTAATLRPNSPTEIAALWNDPDDGGSMITGYDLRHRRSGTSAWTEQAGLTNRSFTLVNLAQGQEYEVQVRAVNADGEGEWSASAYEQTPIPFTPGEGGSYGPPAVAGTWTTLDSRHWEEGYSWGEDEFREEIGQNLELLKVLTDAAGLAASYVGQKLFARKGRPFP